ncbi:MAG: transglycosylase domain-containing protein [Bacteroidota bacterium]
MLITLLFAFVFALLVGFTVLPKAGRFMWRALQRLFVDGSYDCRTLERLLIVELALGLGTFLVFKICLSALAYLLSGDVIEHFVLSRGVFFIEMGQQFALQPKALLMLVGSVTLKFLCCLFIYDRTGDFLRSTESALHRSRAFDLSTQIILSFGAILLFLVLEVVFLAQNIATISKYSNLVLLTMANLSLIAFFVCIIHLRYKRDHAEYFVDLQTYVTVDRFLLRVLRNDLFSIGGVIVFGIVLHLPHYLGLQFLEDNFLLLSLMLGLLLTFVFGVFRRFFKHLFDVLTRVFLLPHFGSEPLSASRQWEVQRPFVQILSVVLGLLVLFKIPGLLVFAAVVSFLGLLAACLLIVAVVGLMRLTRVPFRSSKTEVATEFVSWRLSSEVSAGRGHLRLMGRGLGPGLLPVLLLMILFVAWPKPYPDTARAYSRTLLGEDSVILHQSRSEEGFYSVPIELRQVPRHLIDALLLQEDRGLMRQRSWMPNHHNWFGISATSLLRFVTREGGGSNVTNQLCKNEAFGGRRVQDVQRKFFELIASFQMSLAMTPEEQLALYLNRVSMFGGQGHKGLYMASISAFDRRPSALDPLQSLLLVRSLQYGSRFQFLDGSRVPYSEVKRYPDRVRQALMARYEFWRSQDRVSEQLVAYARRSALFGNPTRSDIPLVTSTREFIKKNLPPDAPVTVSGMSRLNQGQMDKAVRAFNARMSNKLEKGPYGLQPAVLAVELRSGKIIGHHGGSGVSDLADFGAGFQMGSIMKPFVLLELLENGVQVEDLKLYDGRRAGQATVQNFSRRYSNRYVGIDEMLAKSLNAPFHNISELSPAWPLFKKVEKRFRQLGIVEDPSLDFTDLSHQQSYLQNYPLGLRRMTLVDVAKAYQALFNEGLYQWSGLSVDGACDPLRVYDSRSCDVVRGALARTLQPGGTGTHFVGLLPHGKRFYAKTGTSDEAIHGWTVLSDGKVLIIAFVTYAAIIGDRLELNLTPPIPTGSGAQTAGILAALVYNHLESATFAHPPTELLAIR